MEALILAKGALATLRLRRELVSIDRGPVIRGQGVVRRRGLLFRIAKLQIGTSHLFNLINLFQLSRIGTN